MTDDTLCFTPATELAGLLRARKLSPVELVTAVLARAERLQPVLNCFITLVPERALAEAAARKKTLPPAGPAHGIPFTVKDAVKQSNGMVPHSQAQDLFGNQTYVTPMTRTVADTALMLQVMAGPWAVDPWSIGLRAQDYVAAARREGSQAGLRGKRVRYCAAPPGRPVSADVAHNFKAALRTLAGLGATLEPFDGGGFDVEPIWRAIDHTVWRALRTAGGKASRQLQRHLQAADRVGGQRERR